MQGSDGVVGVGLTPWQQQQLWRQQHGGGQQAPYGGGYPQAPFGGSVEQQYQQSLYPQGQQPYSPYGAGTQPYYPNGVPQQQPYIPPPPQQYPQQPCPPGQAIYGGASTCRPLPPTLQQPGQPAPPVLLNTWARWQQVHPGSPYSAYQGWYAQYGASGGTINGLPHETGVGASNAMRGSEGGGHGGGGYGGSHGYGGGHGGWQQQQWQQQQLLQQQQSPCQPWQTQAPDGSCQPATPGGQMSGLPAETGVGAMQVGVGVGYPDHYHVGYDDNQSPIYQDRYGRHHYGHQTGYAPAPIPRQWQTAGYGLSQAPTDAPTSAPPGAAPVVVVPPAAAATPVVVVQHPNGAVTPWYGGMAAQLKLPHPAGAALISAIGAGIGAFAGLKAGPRLPARLHLDSVSAAAAGAAIGAGIAGGVACMLITKTAHTQHAMTTGTPPPA